MTTTGHDSLKTRKTLTVDGKEYDYFSLAEAAKAIGDLSRLPYSLKVLLENLLRFEDGKSVTVDDIKAVGQWLKDKKSDREIAFRPARVLMQDFTGVPAVVDLAAMRDAMVALGGDPQKINPLTNVDLVIDHSVMVDESGTAKAFQGNVKIEFERNMERYVFLRWGSKAFNRFRVVPPGTGICHQVNLEYLAQTVWVEEDEGKSKRQVAYPDTLVGTDSHTTIVNGLSVLGWGVGGIEAEAAMLGQPVSMLIPEVVGFKLTGAMKEGTTATDLVLTVTQMLRKKGVVNKFVEFYGNGLKALSLADRATLANMAPEYGATCGFFPIDDETLNYLRFTGRDAHRVKLVEAYAKAQGLWRDENAADPVFTDTLELELSTVEPSLAGPKRPQDRVALSKAADEFKKQLAIDLGAAPNGAESDFLEEGGAMPPAESKKEQNGGIAVQGADYRITHGHVAIAAITSCTNTSNPSVMLAAGLVAKKALEKGLTVKPWVKTSLAPGSQVVTDYLEKAGLQKDLDALGFNLVGYGCTTCIGNSGPLAGPIEAAIKEGDLTMVGVLSGNRNFEGRIHPFVKANYLASPPLVVAYALAGSMKIDITKDALGTDKAGKPVYLKDIWPSNQEVKETLQKAVTPEMFKKRYGNVFEGPAEWQAVKTSGGMTYKWDPTSTYVQNPPYFVNMPKEPEALHDISGARVLALFGDSITTDHISPAGSIKKDGPAGDYLLKHQVRPADFNSYGSRRGNHEVMMRGTFANIRIRNEMLGGKEGGLTKFIPANETMPIYDAAMKYIDAKTPLIIIAGKEYGTGSSRDWAAKGTNLLGVKAVIAESFERIHRSNLVGMGVLPLQFKDGMTRATLNLTGDETFDVAGIKSGLKPRMDITVTIHRPGGKTEEISALCRIDTLDEIEYFKNGGILHYVLRSIAKAA
ncbi:MAG: aconitate hydratase AcnA [Alphaproteobacteria bacterium]|nr:aconitate hydratase AcnA [Alphaproteobacteria bacterium]